MAQRRHALLLLQLPPGIGCRAQPRIDPQKTTMAPGIARHEQLRIRPPKIITGYQLRRKRAPRFGPAPFDRWGPATPFLHFVRKAQPRMPVARSVALIRAIVASTLMHILASLFSPREPPGEPLSRIVPAPFEDPSAPASGRGPLEFGNPGTVAGAFSRRVLLPASPRDGLLDRHVSYAAAAYCVPRARVGEVDFVCADCPGRKPPPAASLQFGSSAAVVAFDEAMGRVVVSFRGSARGGNWRRNLQIRPVAPWPAHPAVRVHGGFWSTYGRLRAHLRRAVRRAWGQRPGCPRAAATGHSLGGALAALFVADLALDSPGDLGGALDRVCVELAVSFGAPRVGNAAFAEAYAALGVPTFRVAHTHDIFPDLPPGMYHIGTLHMFDYRFSTPSVPCPAGAAFPDGHPCLLRDFASVVAHYHPGGEAAVRAEEHLRYLNTTIGSNACRGRTPG